MSKINAKKYLKRNIVLTWTSLLDKCYSTREVRHKCKGINNCCHKFQIVLCISISCYSCIIIGMKYPAECASFIKFADEMRNPFGTSAEMAAEAAQHNILNLSSL